MAIQRKAIGVWKGDLKEGSGTVTTPDSGVLHSTPYSFHTRFEHQKGTNPEELVAAAHAGCFSMAFSGKLGGLGMTPDSIETTATVKLEKKDAGFRVVGIHLDVRATVPKADPAKVQQAAEDAKNTCPISVLLSSVPVTMEFRAL